MPKSTITLSHLSGAAAPLVLLLFCTPLAPAALLYNNGVPNHQAGNGISNFRTVDDFTLTGPANLNAIRFWLVFNNDDPTNMFSGNISMAIYNNAAGSVGTLVTAATASGLTMTNIGDGGGPLHAYQIDLNFAPVALAAGAYWLELHEGLSLTAADGSESLWAATRTGGNALTQPFFGNFPADLQPIPSYFGCSSCDYDLAFQLFDDSETSVPEPATLSLFALLAGLILAGRAITVPSTFRRAGIRRQSVSTQP
ncbi:MAG: PEP-CTERM sorting domain-containing protein [Acidobacteria bacterium]|nr:PEP-CTERM sorting domain-containing protein [Acidobacteriota bacterium]